MTKSTGALVAVLLVAAAAGAWLLGAGKGIFGSGETVGGPGSTDAPGEIAGPGRDGADADRPDAVAAGPVALAAGGRHPERKGVGKVAGRVAKVTTDAAVAGAVVTLKGTGYGAEPVDLSGTTDAKGTFTFASVPAGLGYEVRVESIGDPVVRLPDVEVKAGRTTDLGAIVVGSHASLAGRVVDEKGVAVASAPVSVYRGYDNMMEMMGNMVELFGNLGHEPTALARATTDAEGRFKLDDLSPGTLSVRATSPGKRQAVARVKLAADGPVGGPVTLTLSSGAVVAGLVVDADGAGVPRATVAVLDSAGGGDPTDMLFGRVFATTDDKGAFRVVVDDGATRLRGIVEAAGFPTTFTPEFAAGAENLRLVLPRAAQIEITLLEGAGNAGIEGAQIMLMIAEQGSMDDTKSGGGIASGVTDAKGVVTLPASPGHIQMLMASHPRLGSAMATPGAMAGGVAVQMGLEGDIPKEVKAGVVTRFTLRMKGGMTVHGKVADKSGTPVAGADVRPFNLMGSSAPGVKTGPDGLYRLEGVSSTMGQGAMIQVVAPGFVKKTDTVLPAEGGGEVTHDVTLTAGASVRGTVLDPAGAPVAAAEISLEGGGFDMAQMFGGTKTATAADGTFVLKDVGSAEVPGMDAEATANNPQMKQWLENNKPKVRVTADGFVSKTIGPVVLTPGGETVLQPVRLARGATVTGLVREPGGVPAAGARIEVNVTPDDGSDAGFNFGRMLAHRTVSCDDQGRFSVPAVAKGVLTLTARGHAGAATRKTLNVGGDDDAPKVQIDLRNALDLKGRVVGPDGHGLAGASVSAATVLEGLLGDDAFVESKAAVTDANGEFALQGLPSGTLKVTATAEGHRSATLLGTTGGAAIEIALAARGAKDEKRLAEIQKEISEISMKFATVKDSSEQQAMQRRLMELMREQRDIQGEGGAGELPPEPPVPTDAPSMR